ncbi:MAG: hypothetical protein WCC59_17555 [Terriglobales bacterium]
MQGRLRGEKLRVRIESSCRHCARPLTIEVDDDLGVLSPGASPLLFEPDMNWQSFHGRNIIHDY